MANIFIINELLTQKNLSITDFCKAVGITPQALRDMVKRNSTKTEILERIATQLHVPIGYFFDNDDCRCIVENNQEQKELITPEQKEIEYLKQIIAEKDLRISELKEHIKLLSDTRDTG